jgi:hypothetical protein
MCPGWLFVMSLSSDSPVESGRGPFDKRPAKGVTFAGAAAENHHACVHRAVNSGERQNRPKTSKYQGVS